MFSSWHPHRIGLKQKMHDSVERLSQETHTGHTTGPLQVLESFSIDDGNGSEKVTFKMNSRFFKLCRVYSN